MNWKRHSSYRLLEIETGVAPSYAFQVGDLTGNGRAQYVLCTPRGDLLRVFETDGRLLWQAEVANADRHGVTALVLADVDKDGQNEVVVGEHPEGSNNLLLFDRSGTMKNRIELPLGKRDYANVAVDSFGLADVDGDGFPELVVAVNGGQLHVLDEKGDILWRLDGLGEHFEHFVQCGDLDLDGRDEIAVSAQAVGENSEDVFFVVDHDGTVSWRRPLSEIGPDAHVDQCLIAPFGEGDEAWLFSATGGCMFDARGNLLWHLREAVNHGQWCEAAKARSDRAGQQILLSELWDFRYGMVLVNNDGRLLWTYDGISEKAFPTPAHYIDWHGTGQRWAIQGEQPDRGTGERHLKIILLDPFGHEVLRIPFVDHRIPGWTYNYENRACVCDVDGCGAEEFVFPTCKGTLMIVGRS